MEDRGVQLERGLTKFALHAVQSALTGTHTKVRLASFSSCQPWVPDTSPR